MVKLNKIGFSALCAICMTLAVSCSQQTETADDLQKEESAARHTCELTLNAPKPSYDDDTRSAAEWEEGDKIFLTFTVGNSTTYGTAIYRSGKWLLDYYGTLSSGKSAACSAVYFENVDFDNTSSVALSENTAIYEDTAGVYIFNDGSLSVTASLKPKTGRIRFSGAEGDEVYIYGITNYSSYSSSNSLFLTATKPIKLKVTDGYTPYIYGMFTDSTLPRLNVYNSEYGFTRTFPTTIYKSGESGYMSLPTPALHDGWVNNLIFKVKGVEFTMIPVEYSDDYGNEANFFLAETETTMQLYYAITGGTTSTPLKPMGTYYNYWDTFISSLNMTTGLKFRRPTLAEWQFAYKGGNKSQGYTYSGSNNLEEVGWYTNNSGNEPHNIKQLRPNELGFYDMSGNVAELVSYTGSSYAYFGGYYSSSPSGCLYNKYESTSGYSSYTGFRLAMSLE